MRLVPLLAAAAALGLAFAPRRARASVAPAVPAPPSGLEPISVVGIMQPPRTDDRYQPPAAAAPYLPLIHATEAAEGIPRDLLTRLLQQESSFLPAIINGTKRSRVGAIGIAQIMPATAADPGFGVPPIDDPADWRQAIPWAGKYLVAMRRYTGSWPLALAAYNMGPGNAKRLARNQWPQETQNYVAQITQDVPVA